MPIKHIKKILNVIHDETTTTVGVISDLKQKVLATSKRITETHIFINKCFIIVLDLQKNFKDSTESPYTTHLASAVRSCITMVCHN